jgi:very-short-patch-repair endonuclease
MPKHHPYQPGRPFTVAMGLGAGMTRREIESPQYRRMFRGIYVEATSPDTTVTRARGARLGLPDDAVFSHWTACRLWAPSAPTSSAIHVSFGRNAFTRLDGVQSHRFTYPIDAVHRHGLPVTSAEQTFVHMAVHLDLVDLVGLGDTLVRRSGVSPAELRRWVRDWPGHGGRRARAAARLVRDRVDSLPESRLRMLLVLSGLQEPVVNHSVIVDGVERYRLDLAYVDQKVAIEYDGRWHERPEQRVKDEARRAELRAMGWVVLVVTADDLFGGPPALLASIVEELGRRGVPLPLRLSDAYRSYFLPGWSVAAPEDAGEADAV